ncbi:hypothetical protein [Polyangium mundeleinium]|uniref:Uncharacterized protein n=1 Tax=Polyangium mundeleinium TaxID=2995306 RepID=A0ABT5EMS8_9BACT|nr:hypothetical protein [Polyangium mundeleinium]MDC0743134.1 hypothetical protein [Polyangium mundeleinium]
MAPRARVRGLDAGLVLVGLVHRGGAALDVGLVLAGRRPQLAGLGLDAGRVLVGLGNRGGAALDVGLVLVGLGNRGGAALDVGLVLVGLGLDMGLVLVGLVHRGARHSTWASCSSASCIEAPRHSTRASRSPDAGPSSSASCIEGRGARRGPRARRLRASRGAALDVGLVLVGLVHRGGAASGERRNLPEVSRGHDRARPRRSAGSTWAGASQPTPRPSRGAALDVGLVLAGPSSSASGSTWASCSSASCIEAA